MSLPPMPLRWHHYRIFTGEENRFVVPVGVHWLGIACWGSGGNCVLPEDPYGAALGGGGGGGFAYGVRKVAPGEVLEQFGSVNLDDIKNARPVGHSHFHDVLFAGAGGPSEAHLGGTPGIGTVKASVLETGDWQRVTVFNGGAGGNGAVDGVFGHYSYGGGGGSGSFYGHGGAGGHGSVIAQAQAYRYPEQEGGYGHGGGGGWGGAGGGGLETPDAGRVMGRSGGGGGGLKDGGRLLLPITLDTLTSADLATAPGGGGGAWGAGEDGDGVLINQRLQPGRGGSSLVQTGGFEPPEAQRRRWVRNSDDLIAPGVPGIASWPLYQGLNGVGHTRSNPFLAAVNGRLDGSGGDGGQYFAAGQGGPGGGGGGGGLIDVETTSGRCRGFGPAGDGGFGGGGGGGIGFIHAPEPNTLPLVVAGHGGFGGGGGGGGAMMRQARDGKAVTYFLSGAGRGGPGGGGAGGGPGSESRGARGGDGCVIFYW